MVSMGRKGRPVLDIFDSVFNSECKIFVIRLTFFIKITQIIYKLHPSWFKYCLITERLKITGEVKATSCSGLILNEQKELFLLLLDLCQTRTAASV